MASYRKPLVCHMSGLACDGGAAMACLAHFSGVYHRAELKAMAFKSS